MDWGLILQALGVASVTIFPVGGWMVRSYLNQQIDKSAKNRDEALDKFKTEMIAVIRTATYPIQPNANGGKSLPDIALAVGRVEGKIETLETSVSELARRMDAHIDANR